MEIDQAIVQAPPPWPRRPLMYFAPGRLLGALYLGLSGRHQDTHRSGRHNSGSWSLCWRRWLLPRSFCPCAASCKKFVDRLVFARRFELPRVLQAIKRSAVAADLDSLMQRVIERTEAVLGGGLELIQDGAEVLCSGQFVPSLRSARAPVSAGADLLMPVFSYDELLGVLRLAGKFTGQGYDAEDLEFLTAVGEQVAIAANQFGLRNERLESEYALDIQRGLPPHREIPLAPEAMRSRRLAACKDGGWRLLRCFSTQ